MDENQFDLSVWTVEGQDIEGSGYESPKGSEEPGKNGDTHGSGEPGKTDDPGNIAPPHQTPPQTPPISDGGDTQPSVKKKISAGWITLIVLAVVAAGFVIYYFGYHEWGIATCTSPSKCSICGKTQGLALGHRWQEATCQIPQTCSICGKTEGVPLEHRWQEATWTIPKTCTLCGSTQGQKQRDTFQISLSFCIYDQETEKYVKYVDSPIDDPFTAASVVLDGQGLSITPRIENKGETTVKETFKMYLDGQQVLCWDSYEYEPGSSWHLTNKLSKSISAGKHIYDFWVNDDLMAIGELDIPFDLPHVHSWLEATCQAPKTCNVCRKTEGDLDVHHWKDATWSEPKTCTVCGITEGKPQRETVSVSFVLWVYDRETGRQLRRAKDSASNEILQVGEAIGVTPYVINDGEVPFSSDIYVYVDNQEVLHWGTDVVFEAGARDILSYPRKIKKAGSHTYSIVVNGETVDRGDFFFYESWL